MNNKVRYAIVMLLGVIMNQGLYLLASVFHWPVWLDVTGTAFSAFVLEPTAGLLVGLVNNFYLALFQYDSSTLLYYSISAAMAIICGCMLKKDGKFAPKRVLPAMGLVILISTALSTALAFWRSGGVPDVGWERTAYEMVLATGAPGPLAAVCAFLIIKTLDTVATALIVALFYLLLPKSLKTAPRKAV